MRKRIVAMVLIGLVFNLFSGSASSENNEKKRTANVKVTAAKNKPDWRTLKPLRSTEGDADMLGGDKTVSSDGAKLTYKFGQMSVEVDIEKNGFCTSPEGEWNVAKNTIINVTVDFYPSKPFAEIGYKIEEFDEYRLNNDLPGIFYLADRKNGVLLKVEERKDDDQLAVRLLRLEPTEAEKSYRC